MKFIAASASAYASGDVEGDRTLDVVGAEGWGTLANSPHVGASPLKINGSALSGNSAPD